MLVPEIFGVIYCPLRTYSWCESPDFTLGKNRRAEDKAGRGEGRGVSSRSWGKKTLSRAVDIRASQTVRYLPSADALIIYTEQ